MAAVRSGEAFNALLSCPITPLRHTGADMEASTAVTAAVHSCYVRKITCAAVFTTAHNITCGNYSSTELFKADL